MASAKSFVKGLATGAVLAGVASLIMAVPEKDKKKRALAKAAHDVKDKIAARAKRLGGLTKSAYDGIVDSTVREYQGMKALSEPELKDLSRELKSSWKEVKAILKSKKQAAKK